MDPDIVEWAEYIYTGTQQHSLSQHLTVEDIATWLSGDGHGNAEKVEDAVNAIMGTQSVEYYENMARLPWAFTYHLGLDSERVVGGVDVSREFD